MRNRCVGVLIALLAVGLLGVGAVGNPASSRVIVFLPPSTAMGDEFFQLMDVFDKHGIEVDVVSAELGPYLFWEDSGEGRLSGVPGGYEYEIEMTYDEVEISNYAVLIVGPAFAHSFWVGDSLPKAEALVQQAYDAGMPLGGVTFGAVFLVTRGYLDGRTTARPPFYKGVVSSERHMAGFLSLYDADYGTECICLDRGGGNVSSILTANYNCVVGFAERIVEEFLSE